MSHDILIPQVLWAQRKDVVYLTIEVFEIQEEKIDLTGNTVTFSGVRSADGAKFGVSLELYSSIDSDSSKISVGHRNVALVLKKTESGPYWPRLLKTAQKMHYIHTDFDKWKEEDEEDEGAEGEAEGPGNFGNFDMSQFAAGGANFGEDSYGDFNEEDDEDVEEEEAVKISGITKDNQHFEADN